IRIVGESKLQMVCDRIIQANYRRFLQVLARFFAFFENSPVYRVSLQLTISIFWIKFFYVLYLVVKFRF
ncbi:MAG TPA: hypothetical protein PKD32_12805, partial [Saprospiraceae bacterium]|nr:hypothetical protein [Saprospiraceae bacterium]